MKKNIKKKVENYGVPLSKQQMQKINGGTAFYPATTIQEETLTKQKGGHKSAQSLVQYMSLLPFIEA